jgi:chemotaxis signal transduction protein
MSESGASDGASASRADRLAVLFVAVGDDTLALETGYVGRIAESVSIRQVPRTASLVAGVSEVDGGVTVVIDLRAVLAGEPTPIDEDRPVVQLDRRRDGDRVGLLVDDVEGFENVDAARLAAVDREPDRENALTAPAETPSDHWFRARIETGDETDTDSVGVLDVEYLLQRAASTTQT